MARGWFFRLVLLAAALSLVALGIWLVVGAAPPSAAPTTSTAAQRSPQAEAMSVLHAWDDQRARAWAAGDVGALTRLYVPGSSAGKADVGVLRRWVARGFVVRRMQRQILKVEIIEHSPRKLVLSVLDRLVSARAEGMDGERVWLPASHARRLRMTFVRPTTQWQLSEVTDPAKGPRQAPR